MAPGAPLSRRASGPIFRHPQRADTGAGAPPPAHAPCLASCLHRSCMPETRDAWGERRPRHLGLWSAVAVLVGSTIGSGIFRVPADVARELVFPGQVLLAWVIGGLIALFGALTYAELAAVLPRSGGVFAYILEAFGPLPAFLFGWSELMVIRASALGAIATIFAEYLGFFVRLTPAEVRWVAAGAVLLVGVFNWLGVRFASVLMNFITVAKYGALALLGVLAFTAGSGSASHFSPVWSGTLDFSVLATALVAIMWTYDGWADLAFMGGEVKNPARTFPVALILGTASILVVYLLLNAAVIYLVPLPEMAGSPLIASTAAARIGVLGASGAAVRAGVAPVPEPVGGHRARHPARDRLRAAQQLPAARGKVHPGHLALLCAGGGGGLRAAADPARSGAALPGVGVSVGAGALPGRVGGDGAERAGDSAGGYRHHLRDHSGRGAGLAGVAPLRRRRRAGERGGAGIYLTPLVAGED